MIEDGDTTYSSDPATSTSAIITSDLMDELIAIRDSFDTSYWRLGDITNIIINQAVARGADNIKMVLYHRIGQIVGKSPKMIRYYAAVSGFYPQQIREKYQLLPFSHFAYAMRFRSGDDTSFGESSKTSEILEYAQSNAEDYHGLPPSVSLLRREFEENLTGNGLENNGSMPPSSQPIDRRVAPPDVSVLDMFPIVANDDMRDRQDVIDARREVAIQRLATLISEIVPLVQFVGNPALAMVVSRLVESIRYFIEHHEDEDMM
jgi:hypothetical protein